jgi:2-hydroxy-3-oxopropionate reductase
VKILKDWKIGFIGLGLMGKPMARNLLRAGAKMVVHNRSQLSVRELEQEGMTAGKNPADVARQSDVIILMLTDSSAVENVVTGENGVLDGLTEGAVVIDMSTTKVSLTRELATRVRAIGGDYVDAPVSGGTIGAEGGSLSIMAGGTDSAIECVMPVFEVLGTKTTHVGEVGAGQVTKTANQMIVGLNIGAVAEALTLAKKAGVEPALVRQALGGGFADSRILEVHGKRMVEGTFTPGGRATVQLKDMNQALEFAGQLGIDLPATQLNRDLYDQLVDAGHGDLDHSALIKAIEPAD